MKAGVKNSYEYTFDLNPLIADHSVRIGFFIIPKVRTCISNISISGPIDVYTESVIQANEEVLSLQVRKDEIISAINQSAEQVSIKASKIDLTGDVSLHGDFSTYSATDRSSYTKVNDGSITIFDNNCQVFTLASRPIIGEKSWNILWRSG